MLHGIRLATLSVGRRLGIIFTIMLRLDRRAFVCAGAGAAVGAVLPACSTVPQNEVPLVRFGLVTDLHFARIPARGNRQYAQSAAKLSRIVSAMNEAQPDFMVELGDFKDLGPTKAETLAYLDEIEGVFRGFKGPRYHVLGNHDTDCLSKEEFLAHVDHAGYEGTYYSFVQNGIVFVVLDACFTSDMKPYCCANPWEDANIPPKELAWLERTLAVASGPVVVFCHQRLDPESEPRHLIRNAAAVRAVLEQSGKVRSVFTGHQHGGGDCTHNGIRYFTLSALVMGADMPSAIIELFSDGRVNINADVLPESSYRKEIKS